MARSRNIKPGFYTNEDLLECEPLARILFSGLWCWADRDGRLEDRPKKFKIEIMPGDTCDINSLLQQLIDRKLLVRYQVDGVSYLWIPKFLTHQNPHNKEVLSSIPKYDQNLHCNTVTSEQHQPRSVLIPTEEVTDRALSCFLIPDSSFLIPKDIPAKKRRSSVQKVDTFILPDWVPKKEWDDYIDSRKKKPTASGKEILVDDLDMLRKANDYDDPYSVLRNATKRGWTGLFTTKGFDNGKPKQKHDNFAQQDFLAGSEGFEVN